MAESVPSILTSRLATLNPFSINKIDEEDQGVAIDSSTIAGGGHAARRTALTKDQLRVSQAIKSFLVTEGILSEADVDIKSDKQTAALRELLDKSHIEVPAYVTDRSHPLPEYFVSSSHNTYLTAHQLYGSSSATAYETALGMGARCVEIDAWDHEENPQEPKVTHGYTLASNIPFRKVCEAIRDVIDHEAKDHHAAPILLSLENHCGPEGQLRLAQIMQEVWGDRLLSKPIRDAGTREQEGSGEHIRLEQLGNKVAVIVEYNFPSADQEEDSESEHEREDEQTKADHQAYREKKKQAVVSGIIPELAELGVYAQSVKPVDKSWLEGELKNGPHHHLINVSESGLSSLMPASSNKIAVHNSQHLMRVFPKGTRIFSKNLKAVPFWGVGAQICALNSQTFDASMQLNEALFSGSDGYVLKPAALRAGGNGKLNTGRQKKLKLHVAGASEVPVPEGDEPDDLRPYVTCSLLHPDHIEESPPKRKTDVYKPHKLGMLHKGPNPHSKDPIWNDVLEWEYNDNELVFLRILIKSDDRFAKNPMFAVAAVRLMYAAEGWSFIRMLDLKGRETHCTLLVKFEFEDI